MTPLEFIAARRSVRTERLEGPGPDAETLGRILQAAVSAPDHGGLRPWRFLVTRPDGMAALADLFEKALLARQPDAIPAAIAATRAKAMRSPLIVTVCAQITAGHPKVPVEEQATAAACAAAHVLLAAEAAGYGAILLTGWMAHDPLVRAGLGLGAEDRIIGFIHMGTPAGGRPAPLPRPEAAAFTRAWP